MIRIKVYDGEKLVTELGSDKEISIGRAPGCAILIDDPTISRLHAVILPGRDGWIVQRLDGAGPVLLNGREIANASLEGGEELVVGPYRLRVEIVPAEARGEPVAAAEAREDDQRTRPLRSEIRILFRLPPGAAGKEEFVLGNSVAIFGRGTNCDVVLTEKKASRKHFEVYRKGLSVFLKDLNSANATLVNGIAVTETELAPGDVIRVGETEIRFSAEHGEYFERRDSFLPLPAALSPENVTVPGDAPVAAPSAEAPEVGADGTPLPPRPNTSTDLLGHALYRWARIPKEQRLRYLTILVAGCLVMALLGTPPGEVQPPAGGTPTGNHRYDALSARNKAFVKQSYKELLTAFELKDYERMSLAARNILALVDDYNDTKSYETIARKALEERERERERAAADARAKEIQLEVIELVKRGEAILESALRDERAQPPLDKIMQEIVVRDPENRHVADWKSRLADAREAEKKAADLARRRQELRDKAEAEFARVEKLYRNEKYLEAIAEAGRLPDIGWSEEGYPERVDKLKADIRVSLRNVLDPLLAEARRQREEGGDLVKARERYAEVLRIDTGNEEARRGMGEIRQVLVSEARSFYAEATLAESVSDLSVARDNYQKCLTVAPDDPNLPPNQDYRSRCRRKLVRYETFEHKASGKKF